MDSLFHYRDTNSPLVRRLEESSYERHIAYIPGHLQQSPFFEFPRDLVKLIRISRHPKSIYLVASWWCWAHDVSLEPHMRTHNQGALA